MPASFPIEFEVLGPLPPCATAGGDRYGYISMHVLLTTVVTASRAHLLWLYPSKQASDGMFLYVML